MTGKVPRGRQLLRVVCAALLALAPAAAMAHFDAHRDNPRTAAPPVARPDVPPCAIEIVDHRFDSSEPARSRIDAPMQCPGPWQRIVIELTGKVAGRQYDRLSSLKIGGVTLLRTSTPEPSGPTAITWTVEKDITGYAPVFTKPQDVEMELGNVVDKTFTGVFDVHVRILFYPAARRQEGADSAEAIAPLGDVHHDGTDTVGMLRLPADAERLALEVYATGSGGGCEEFWYFVLPPDKTAKDQTCRGEQGPYREVQVLIDGRVAGIAAPYPHIYTGGWSNPILWYSIPAPRAFDIKPLRFELTPFVGELNDGAAHEVRLRVLGVPEDGRGWALLPNVLLWRDSSGKPTHGELLQADVTPLILDNSLRTKDGLVFNSSGRRRFVARGVLRTSDGTVETDVEQSLTSAIEHEGGADAHDAVRGEWTDRRVVTRRVGPALPTAETEDRRFGLEGAIDTAKVDAATRLTTTLSVYDEAEHRRSAGARASSWQQTSDRFDGSASYNLSVPREKRQPAATSREEYLRRDRDGHCYRRVLRAQDGRFVEDSAGCGGIAVAAPPAAGGMPAAAR